MTDSPASRPPLEPKGMKIHLSLMRPNQWGGFNVRSLCGRIHSESQDGMNLTDNGDKVTCKFCLKHPRFAEVSADA